MNTTTTTTSSRRVQRVEDLVQVIILLAVGIMAGAASFTHVHDWTMHNSPEGTPGWFGWANAVISELTPIAAGLEARRRARNQRSVTYPVTLLTASVAFSLAAQFAVAKPGITGWLISAVPAMAFMALVKLVISRTPATTPAATAITAIENPGEPTAAARTAPTTAVKTVDADGAGNPAPVPAAMDHPPSGLVMSANLLAAQHRNSTGRSITPAELAERLSVDLATAGQLLGADNPQPTTRVNGHDPIPVVTR